MENNYGIPARAVDRNAEIAGRDLSDFLKFGHPGGPVAAAEYAARKAEKAAQTPAEVQLAHAAELAGPVALGGAES